jgi:V/A-type H+/Na+-transporting ATPase subunit E
VALEQLLAALETDARAQADRLLAEARAAAQRIEQEAEERAGQRRDLVLEERGRDLRTAAEGALADARRRGRCAALTARAQFVEQVFDAAREQLAAAIDRPDYRAALPGILAEALAALGDEAKVTVRCAPALVADIRRAARAPACAVTADDRVGAGFTAATADGDIEIDATLEARLVRLRPLLAIQLLAELEHPA